MWGKTEKKRQKYCTFKVKVDGVGEYYKKWEVAEKWQMGGGGGQKSRPSAVL
jgi:hypothetical protein